MFLIFTEKSKPIHKVNIVKAVSREFDGFTISDSLGFWKGSAEKSCIIILVTENQDAVNSVAEEIKLLNKQECVLVVKVEANHYFV
jgi:alpha/beta superfamily hydrolase